MISTRTLSIVFGLLALAFGGGASAAKLELYPASSTGIPYQWLVTMKAGETISFIKQVGAKSWNEPTTPGKGWTHTSDWVAFELTERAHVTIKVTRQMGVTHGDPGDLQLARKYLYPALSVYETWDTISSVPHQYENSANITGTTVIYLGNAPNTRKPSTVYDATLDAGKYTIAIGGNPPALATYPPVNCNPVTSQKCYIYFGNHGFRTVITTKRP
jgi:hypothetical protein